MVPALRLCASRRAARRAKPAHSNEHSGEKKTQQKSQTCSIIMIMPRKLHCLRVGSGARPPAPRTAPRGNQWRTGLSDAGRTR